MNIGEGYRIEMVNYDVTTDFSVEYAEVAPEVSSDDVTTEGSPFLRSVKNLIQISVIAESFLTDFTVEFEVVVALFESWEGDEGGVGFSSHERALPPRPSRCNYA